MECVAQSAAIIDNLTQIHNTSVDLIENNIYKYDDGISDRL